MGNRVSVPALPTVITSALLALNPACGGGDEDRTRPAADQQAQLAVPRHDTLPIPSTRGVGSAGLYRGGAGRPGVSPGPGPSFPLRVSWQGPPGRDQDSVGRTLGVVFGAGVAYAIGAGGVYALDASTGVLLWRLPRQVYGTPTLHEDVLFAPGEHALYAFDAASGNERWQSPLARQALFFPAPTAAGGFLYGVIDPVDEDNPQLLAIHALSGTEAWRVSLGHDDRRERFAGATVAGAGMIFVITGESGGVTPAELRVEAFDQTSGHKGWSAQLTPLVGEAHIFMGLFTDGRVLLFRGSATVQALDAGTGEHLWQRTLPGQDLPYLAMARTRVFVTSVEGGTHGVLTAIDLRSGQVDWRFERAHEELLWPTVVGSMLYLQARPIRSAPEAATLYVVNSDTGDPVGAYYSDSPLLGPPTIVNGMILVMTPEGTVFALTSANAAAR